MPAWIFAPETWVIFWIALGALALWAVWTGSREWDKFEELLELFDQEAYDRDENT